ncbi:MAG: nucleotidyltransferase family protein [Thermoleophilia bacterium]
MRVTGLLLAAGSSRRMGRPKQLIAIAGRPLVVHAVDALRDGGVQDVLVVLGAAAEDVAAVLPAGVRTVVNPAHATGQASSLRAGLAALDDGVDAVVAMVCDRPGVTAAAVRDVVAAASAHPRFPAAAARYDDVRGHPVLLRRELFPELAALTGDTGARAILGRVPVLDVPVPGPAPPDVDTPEDLAAAQAG